MNKKGNIKRKLEDLTYDKRGLNKKILNIKNSMDEISKILNTNKNTKK